jgi:hypothetical protein
MTRLMRMSILRVLAFIPGVVLAFLVLVIKEVLQACSGSERSGEHTAKAAPSKAPGDTTPAFAAASASAVPDATPGGASGMEAAARHSVVAFGESIVNFAFYAGATPRITRLLKQKTERLPWQRARVAFARKQMADFTPAMAAHAKLPFTLAGAVELTKLELKGLASVQPKMPAPVAKAGAATVPAVAAEGVPATSSFAARPTVATGEVTTAGLVTVTVPGRAPYRAFQITVSDGANGAVFSGVDLQEKFEQGVFGLHDRIHIEKAPVDFAVEADEGTTSKRRKNVYRIEVLQKATH